MNLLDEKRDLWNGFGEGLSRAFEFAVTPALFAGIGLVLDRRIGIFPVFTIGLLVFALVGMFIRLWFSYDAQMRSIEEKGAWRRSDPTHAQSAPTEGSAA